MAFINTTLPKQASGDTRSMYAHFQDVYGYVPNYAKVFSHRPQLMEKWSELLSTIRGPMSSRRFEITTLAAAHALGSSYCSLAHGVALRKHLTNHEIKALLTSEPNDSINEMDRDIVTFARRIASDASNVRREDVDKLAKHDIQPDEIFDIAATVAARSFFTKLLDALGVQPDSELDAVETELKDVLVVGRPIDMSPKESMEL